MNYKVRLLLIVLVTCAALIIVGDEADAAEFDLELELNDTSSVKVASDRDPIAFNWTLRNNGSAADQLIVIDVIEVPQNWSNLLLSTSVTVSPPDPMGPPCEVLMEREETIEVWLVITPPINQLNETYWFTLIAYPKADPGYNVTYEVGVIVPQKADFLIELWNPPPSGTFYAVPPATVTMRFALYNTGNGVDRFLIQGSSSRSDDGWTLTFIAGVNEWGFTENLTADPLMENPHFIDVKVPVPAGTYANDECLVTLEATSMFNVTIVRPSATATIKALQYYNFQVYIKGPDKKEGIPGEEVAFQLIVQHQGNGPDTFSLRAIWDEELNPGFVAYTIPSNITLLQNENGTVMYFVEVPEDAPKKTYFLTCEVRSSSPELAPVTKAFGLEVGQFFGVDVTCDDPNRITDPGGNLEFELQVKNTGNGLDSIVIREFEGAPDNWLTYTQPPEVTLLQGQSAEIKVIVIVPSQFEEVPTMGYTLTVLAASSRSDARGSVDLFIDITQFWRIEWMYWGEDITNPDRPVAQPGSVRPRPELDLQNETATTVVLGVRNYGNGPDVIVVEVHNLNDLVEVEFTPTTFHLESTVTQDITITITVPMNFDPGVYSFVMKARSTDESVFVRSVPMDFLVLPVFTEEDFAALGYIADEVNDDYLFTFTSDEPGGDVLESSGRRMRSSNIDIVSITAVHDHSTGKVTVTLTCAADILIEEGTEYWVFFVNGNHRQPGTLLNPWEHRNGSFAWTFSDQAMTEFNLYYTNGVWGTTYVSSGIEADVSGATITFTVPSRDLRVAGVDSGSGFGIYAYAHAMTERNDGDYRMRVDWDTAGKGAARSPAEFFNEQELEEPVAPYLLSLLVGLITIVVIVIAMVMRLDGGTQ